MFKLSLADIRPLKDALQAIAPLITEGTFTVTPESVRLLAADPAMVSLVDLKIFPSLFSSYEVKKKEKISLNIDGLVSVLKRAKGTDVVHLESDDQAFTVTLEGKSKRTFSLPLLKMGDSDVPSTDKLSFTHTLALPASVLSGALGDASIIGSSVVLEVKENGFHLSSESNSSRVAFSLPKGSDELLESTGEGSIRSMYSLDYLNKIIKAEKVSGSVTLRMGNDFPLRLEFFVPDKVELGFILAPRIEEE